MLNSRIHTVVFDLDNTLWDWVSYAVKTYPAMRDLLVRQTGETRERVTECMRNFYQRAGTIESSWLVQDLERQGLFKADEADRERLIKAVRSTFHSCRQKYLRFFEGFPSILEKAAENDVRCLVHTDAPATHAASRIRHLYLDQTLCNGMIAMPDNLPREVPGRFLKKFERENYGVRFPVHLANREKPNADIEEPLGMTADEIGEGVAYVGDNYPKDMGQIARYGGVGIHAEYGKSKPSDLEIVREFSGHQIANRNSAQDATVIQFPNVIPAKRPHDIPRILGWR